MEIKFRNVIVSGEGVEADLVNQAINSWYDSNYGRPPTAEELADGQGEYNAGKVAITYRQDAKQFLIDNPQARQLLDLPLADLLTAIQNRTAAQETLLLKTLAVAVRFLYEEVRSKGE